MDQGPQAQLAVWQRSQVYHHTQPQAGCRGWQGVLQRLHVVAVAELLEDSSSGASPHTAAGAVRGALQRLHVVAVAELLEEVGIQASPHTAAGRLQGL